MSFTRYAEMKPRLFKLGDIVVGRRLGSKNDRYCGELVDTYATVTESGFRNQAYVIKGGDGRRLSFQHVTLLDDYATEMKHAVLGDKVNLPERACSQCGKPMGFEQFLGPVCGACCRENQAKAAGGREMKATVIRQGKAKRVLGYESERKAALKEILAVLPTGDELLDRQPADKPGDNQTGMSFEEVCEHAWDVVGVQEDSGGETLECLKCGAIRQCWFE